MKIEWNGEGCPVPDGTPVRVWFADTWTSVGVPDEFEWGPEADPACRVVAYEVLAPLDQWEYKMAPQPRDTTQGIVDDLNFYGADGWELAAIDYGHFIFKRRKA